MDKTTPKIGHILTPEDDLKDAVHVAVVPVEAAVPLMTGERIGLDSEGKASSEVQNKIGIVDPFLSRRAVAAGEKFYLFLFPGTITSLRHVWTHPVFDKDIQPEPTLSDVEYSERWLKDYAARMNDYDSPEQASRRLMEGLRSGELFSHGSDLHCFADLDDPDELKKHAEIVLGIPINWSNFTFSCSC